MTLQMETFSVCLVKPIDYIRNPDLGVGGQLPRRSLHGNVYNLGEKQMETVLPNRI